MQKLKKIGALSLLTLLLVKAMVVPAIFFNYELRKDFIIQNFCVNKDRPELNCDGKCYLAKQLKAAKQQDENESEAAFVDKLLVFECLSLNSNYTFPDTFPYSDSGVAIPVIPHLLEMSRPFSIFHPPQFIS
ncbi:MAG: hypothetical protein ACI9IP_001222 [Arcticibacterium sp.]|jgi:hypothetical protein